MIMESKTKTKENTKTQDKSTQLAEKEQRRLNKLTKRMFAYYNVGKLAEAEELIEAGADYVNGRTDIGWTVLHHACFTNDLDRVRRFIEAGVDVNVISSRGETALHNSFAMTDITPQRIEVVKLFIESGFDVNIMAYEGKNALLDWCSGWHATEDIVKVLIDAGADVNNKDEHGRTSLHHACGYNKERIAELLIDAGADVNVKDKFGHTPLYYYREYGSKRLEKKLIEAGAEG